MKIQKLALGSLLACALSFSAAFQAQRPTLRSPVSLYSTVEEERDLERKSAVEKLERAAALSDYLAMAYEDKQRAIEEIEARNNKEIEELKKQIEDLKVSKAAKKAAPPAPPKIGDVSKLSDAQLQSKIKEYEKYMAAVQDDDTVSKADKDKISKVLQDLKSAVASPKAAAGAAAGAAGGETVLSADASSAAAGISALSVISGALGGYIVDQSRRDSFAGIMSGVAMPQVAGQLGKAGKPAAAPPAQVWEVS